jgi:hypothetical protein
VADDVALASQEAVASEAEATGEEETLQSAAAEGAAVSDARDDLSAIGLHDEEGERNDEGNSALENALGDDRNPAPAER